MLVFSVVGFDVIAAREVLPQIGPVDTALASQIFWSVVVVNCCLVACLAFMLPGTWKRVVRHQTQNDAAGYNLVRERELRWMEWVGRSVTKRKNAASAETKA
jgi:hypothetical protein